jgi:3-oxoacyl-(acyl-carrier-protein) synthase
VEVSVVYARAAGVVSPAGWGLKPFLEAAQDRPGLPIKEVAHPGGGKTPRRLRTCPAPLERPGWLAHSRLRRSSPISQYTMGAAMEALAEAEIHPDDIKTRLGVIVSVFTGCVQYSRRFYQEVLQDPATASPLLFPETVFNAPASHLGAFLGATSLNYTLVGDKGTFHLGLAMAAEWIVSRKVEHCLVVAAEESDWLASEGLTLFHKNAILSEGAGALLLSRLPGRNPRRVQLCSISDEFLYAQHGREIAQRKALDEVGATPQQLGLMNSNSASLAEVFGDALIASSAWQSILAIQAIHSEKATEAIALAEGWREHAIAAKFQLEKG